LQDINQKTILTIALEDPDVIVKIFGKYDENIVLVEKMFKVKIQVNDGNLRIEGLEQSAKAAKAVIEEMKQYLRKEDQLDKNTVEYIANLQKKGLEKAFSKLQDDTICFTTRGKPIKSKTLGQHQYIEAIRQNDIVFGIGPAGTGKTYLAMAVAITAFKNGEVNRLILTRPAVEAGEKLGFLPGDLQDKVDPYLRPLYDALYEIMGAEAFASNMEKGLIEVAPLAYMRGRTLENAYIILDEAQNTTSEQMKMFLTRFGMGSKMIVTGDVTQTDLPSGKRSGLKTVRNILKDIKGIAFVNFTEQDVVRHRLVQRIIVAYDRAEQKKKKQEK